MRLHSRNRRIADAARGRSRSTTIQKIILQRSNIPQRIIRLCVPRKLHGIYDRDRSAAKVVRQLRPSLIPVSLSTPRSFAFLFVVLKRLSQATQYFS